MIVLHEGRVCVSGSKKAFMEDFRCYRFDRTDASGVLGADELLSDVEQTADATVVYGFLKKETLQDHLAGLGVQHPSLQEIPMSFEDAFIGLTGKY
jgi:ABC-2 type transport system ATP-binding protein